MTRLITFVTIPAVLVAVAPAAPVPKETPRPLYHPTAVGATWVYEVERSGVRSEQTFRVAEATPGPDGGTTVRVHRVFPAPKPGPRPEESYHQTLAVSRDGVAVTDDRLAGYDPPHRLVRLPARPGESWRWAVPGVWRGRAAETGTRTTAGEEEVEVPAGRFRAVRVESAGATGGGKARSTHWYAPGVGEVRGERDGWTLRLKSFTPGRDDPPAGR